MEEQSASRRRFLAALGAAGTAGLAGCAAGYQPPGSAGAAGAEQPADADRSTDGSPYTAVYDDLAPSVARVRVVTDDGGAQGSAAVYGERRLVTNQHVVAGARNVSVVYTGGEYVTAEVEGTDVYSDLAVLRVDGHPGDPPALSFATPDPAIGTEVVVIGTPLGLGESVSSGIVSGVDRSLPAANNFTIPDAIQTDAAANPGNSGGPLVALDGTPLGLVNSGTGIDITFAISGALVNRVVPALVEDGEYDHAFMGVSVRDLTPPLARANGLESLRGVYIDDVLDGGPADGTLRGSTGERRALGEQVPTGGDVVVALDGRPMPSNGALGTHLALEESPGDVLSVTVVRDGTRETVEFELGERPEP